MPQSCIWLTTDDNRGNVNIQMHFESGGVQDFGKQEIDYGMAESWSHCFMTGDLLFLTVQNDDGKSWTGEIYMTHDDKKDVGLFECENCACQCNGTSADTCNGECLVQQVVHIGIDDDSNVDGDTKCIDSHSCQFRVSWAEGTCFQSLSNLPNYNI